MDEFDLQIGYAFMFLGIDNLQQKFGGSISKIVDFFLMSNFC